MNKCNICKQKLEESKNYKELLFCSSCYLYQLKKFPTKKELIKAYNAFYSEEDGTRFDKNSEAIISFFRRLRKRDVLNFCKKGNLLDIGYGRPIDLEIFKETELKPTGTQISETSYKAAKKKNLDVVYGDLLDLKFKKKFSIITFWHVLEHVKDPDAYIKKCYFLLNKQGKIIIEVPNIGSWIARKTKYRWFALDLENHLYQFSKKSLIKLLEKNGFCIKKISYFSPEISPFSELQTFLNLLFKKQNLFFKIMKREEKKKIFYCLLGIFLYPLAFISSLVLALLKEGDIIKIYAKKKT